MYLNRNSNKISVLVSDFTTTILISERVQLHHFASFLSKLCLPSLILHNDSFTDWLSRNPVTQSRAQFFVLFDKNHEFMVVPQT